MNKFLLHIIFTHIFHNFSLQNNFYELGWNIYDHYKYIQNNYGEIFHMINCFNEIHIFYYVNITNINLNIFYSMYNFYTS